jgi:transcriptional regulator with XRE-family HTH domain
MSIGSTIKKIRERHHLKQEEIAKKLNMSVTGYGKIERDEVSVNQDRLEEIAKVFGVNAIEILAEEKNVQGFSVTQNNNNPTGNNIGVFYISEKEKELFEKLLTEKDKRIEGLERENDLLREMLKNK